MRPPPDGLLLVSAKLTETFPTDSPKAAADQFFNFFATYLAKAGVPAVKLRQSVLRSAPVSSC